MSPIRIKSSPPLAPTRHFDEFEKKRIYFSFFYELSTSLLFFFLLQGYRQYKVIFMNKFKHWRLISFDLNVRM